MDNNERPAQDTQRSPYDGYYVVRRPAFDPDYVFEPCSLAAFICISIANYGDIGCNLASMITIAAFLYSLVLLLLYFFHIVETTAESINWLIVEVICLGIFAVSFLLTFAFFIVYSVRLQHHTWIAGSLFCLVAMVAYNCDFILRLRAWRRGDKPQRPAYCYTGVPLQVTATGGVVQDGLPPPQRFVKKSPAQTAL